MIKYTVDKEKGIVTAEIDGCENDVLRLLEKACKTKFIGINQKAEIEKAAQISGSFKGVAKCHPDDLFDEELGKNIAKSRMLNKYHEARIKALNRVDALLSKFDFDIMVAIQHSVAMIRDHEVKGINK